MVVPQEQLTSLQAATINALRGRGKKNPIIGKHIAEIIGLKPRSSGKEGADMRSIIHALRLKGYPICATGSGYWWPANSGELGDYLGSLQRRIADIAKALAAMQWEGAEKIYMDAPEKLQNEAHRFGVQLPDRYTIFNVKHDRMAEFKRMYPKAVEL